MPNVTLGESEAGGWDFESLEEGAVGNFVMCLRQWLAD